MVVTDACQGCTHASLGYFHASRIPYNFLHSHVIVSSNNISSHQSTAVANITVTTGYLATLISVSAQCLFPRAKYLKILFFALLASCMAAALCCLACYTAIKARGSHGTVDGVDTGLGVYDSTASAVSGIWLFVMIWLVPPIILLSQLSTNALAGSLTAFEHGVQASSRIRWLHSPSSL